MTEEILKLEAAYEEAKRSRDVPWRIMDKDRMTRTGRPKSETKMIRRTIRNRPEIDAEALKLAKFDGQKIGEWLRECVELRVEGRR